MPPRQNIKLACWVVVITYDLTKDCVHGERRINLNNADQARWLSRNQRWAVANQCSVEVISELDDVADIARNS